MADEPNTLMGIGQRSLDMPPPPHYPEDVPHSLIEHEVAPQTPKPCISHVTPCRITTEVQPITIIKTEPTVISLESYMIEEDNSNFSDIIFHQYPLMTTLNKLKLQVLYKNLQKTMPKCQKATTNCPWCYLL